MARILRDDRARADITVNPASTGTRPARFARLRPLAVATHAFSLTRSARSPCADGDGGLSAARWCSRMCTTRRAAVRSADVGRQSRVSGSPIDLGRAARDGTPDDAVVVASALGVAQRGCRRLAGHADGHTVAMAVRLLLGVIAALRAVLIPGQAALMTDEPLEWPTWNVHRRRRQDAVIACQGHTRAVMPTAVVAEALLMDGAAVPPPR